MIAWQASLPAGYRLIAYDSIGSTNDEAKRLAREGAAEEDVSLWWTHVVSLHRKSRTLHKELKDAEAALGTEPNEENLAWLRDIQTRHTA